MQKFNQENKNINFPRKAEDTAKDIKTLLRNFKKKYLKSMKLLRTVYIGPLLELILTNTIQLKYH